METVTLQFQTPQDFSGFRKTTSPEAILEISIKDLTVVCRCSMIDIAKSMNHYGAVVVEKKD